MLFKKPKEKQYISRSFLTSIRFLQYTHRILNLSPALTQCLDILIKTLLAITTWDHRRC